jgi:toxin HigB-1
VVRSFGDAQTARFAAGARVKQFEPFRRQAEKTLDRLDAATSLLDLASFPGHRLEKLKGERAGTFSIRINDRWRICFAWPQGSLGPECVTIEDYHD